VIKLLIALGADVNKADENGITPLQMALEVSGELENSDVTDSRGFETGVTLGHTNDVMSMNGTYSEEGLKGRWSATVWADLGRGGPN